MSSSQKTTLAWQRYTPGVLFVSMVVMMVLDQGVLVQTRIERAHSNTSAEIGKFGFIVYNVSEKTEPEIKCFSGRYNCTTPVGLCSDDHDKYKVEYVENSHYQDVEMFEHWQCRVRIKEISLADVGPYSMCIRPYIDGDRYDKCISKEKNIEPVYLAVWERDEHGRICQRKYDQDSADISNNCSTLTTGNTASSLATTTASAPTKTYSGTNFISITMITNKPPARRTGTAVGIPVTFIIIIIVIIIGAVYFYKKRNGWRRHGHTQVPIDETVNENGNTTKTININLTSQDHVKIAIVSEDTSLQADPE